MKTTMKKITACLLALLLVLQIVPVFADQTYSNVQGSINPDNYREKLEIRTKDNNSILTVNMTTEFIITEGYNNLKWSSDNESVATVDSNTGVVTAVGPGQVRITATEGEFSDSVTLKVIGDAAAETGSTGGTMIIIISGSKEKITYDGEIHTAPYTATSNDSRFDPDKVKLTDESLLASGKDCNAYQDKLSAEFFEYSGDEEVEFVVSNGWLQIRPAQVTVTANPAEKKAGEADPELTAVVTGLVGEDTINYTIERYPGEEVGKHIIDVYGDEKQGNYRIKYVPGIMTITESESGNEETQEPLNVWISSLHPADEPVEYGMEITLVAEVTGAAEGEYTICWQYSTDMINWIDIPGSNSLTYTFTADGDTVTYAWRAVADRIQ